MSKIYLVKNTQATAKDMTDWIEMNGFDFYKFIKSPEANGRYFIKLPPLLEDGSDGFITIEANSEKYRKWRSEVRRKRHLREYGTEEKNYTVVSYHAMETADGCYGEELLPDDSINIEAEVEKIVELENLADALTRITAAERWLIDEIYAHEKDQPEIALLLGITQQAVSKRVARIIKKIKKLMNLKI